MSPNVLFSTLGQNRDYCFIPSKTSYNRKNYGVYIVAFQISKMLASFLPSLFISSCWVFEKYLITSKRLKANENVKMQWTQVGTQQKKHWIKKMKHQTERHIAADGKNKTKDLIWSSEKPSQSSLWRMIRWPTVSMLLRCIEEGHFICLIHRGKIFTLEDQAVQGHIQMWPLTIAVEGSDRGESAWKRNIRDAVAVNVTRISLFILL